jgi:hypothetical protein
MFSHVLPHRCVSVPPDILYDETSADLSVQENENATLVCKATGHPPPRITWRREDGEPILLRRGPRDVIKGNGAIAVASRVHS